MREPLSLERMNELRANVPHAEWADLAIALHGAADPAASQELRADLNTYAARYAKPESNNRNCLACDECMAGFEWGLQHGEGHCRQCGWPATLYHFIKDRNGTDLTVIRGIMLQYHPSALRLKCEPEDATGT